MHINKEYRACLLYILAGEYPDLRFVRSDSGYSLYDEEKMVSRLIDMAGAAKKETFPISDFDIPLPAEELVRLTGIASERGVHITVEQDDTT